MGLTLQLPMKVMPEHPLSLDEVKKALIFTLEEGKGRFFLAQEHHLGTPLTTRSWQSNFSLTSC